MITSKKDANNRFDYWRIAAVAFAAVLVVLNLLRIFDNNFWGDEAFTIRLSWMSVPEMLRATAEDVHPPLYYGIVQLFCKVFGYTGVVYHLASFVPYVLVIVVALTLIWKWFGGSASVILIILSSLLETSVIFNVEVRMYSWGSLFMLASFLALYSIFTKNRTRDYVWFVLASLAGAYTHYYCLVAVAFFYVILIGLALIKREAYFKKTLIACLVTVAAYLPWLIVLLQTFRRTMGDFWMTYIPYLKDCFAYLFSGRLQYVLLAIMLLAVMLTAWYQRKDFSKVLWLAAGMSSIFGTILVGNLVSRIFRPVFIVRYLYPVAIIAWVLLAVGIASLKKKHIYCAIISVALLITCIPQYFTAYQADKQQNELLRMTLEATADISGEDSVILTNLEYLDWTVLDYYYPEVEHVLLDTAEIPVLDKEHTYWLMLQGEILADVVTQLEVQGYAADTVVENGTLGTNPVVVYKINKSYTKNVY